MAASTTNRIGRDRWRPQGIDAGGRSLVTDSIGARRLVFPSG